VRAIKLTTKLGVGGASSLPAEGKAGGEPAEDASEPAEGTREPADGDRAAG
jgi:hypothetical protein